MGIKAVWKCHHRVVILSPRNLSEILCNPVREVLQFFPCPGNAGGSVQPGSLQPLAQPSPYQWGLSSGRLLLPGLCQEPVVKDSIPLGKMLLPLWAQA